jgi:phytoene dehydrogenase-like protein
MHSNGQANGIKLVGNKEFTSKVVLSNATPHHTFTKFLDPKDLPDDFNKIVE